MAKQPPQTTARRAAVRPTSPGRRASTQSTISFGFPWSQKNVIGIGAGLAVIVIGYILMSTAITPDVANNDGIWNNSNAVTVAPILLVIGYCIIIPYFIFKRFGAKQEEEAQ